MEDENQRNQATDVLPDSKMSNDEADSMKEYNKDNDSTKDQDTYLIYGSDIRYITEEDINWMDATTLELARNEIYARHGRRFNAESIQQYFDQQTWYFGTISPEDFSDEVFNEYERANIDFIVAYENGNNFGQ